MPEVAAHALPAIGLARTPTATRTPDATFATVDRAVVREADDVLEIPSAERTSVHEDFVAVGPRAIESCDGRPNG